MAKRDMDLLMVQQVQMVLRWARRNESLGIQEEEKMTVQMEFRVQALEMLNKMDQLMERINLMETAI
jgi:hypothetical protein